MGNEGVGTFPKSIVILLPHTAGRQRGRRSRRQGQEASGARTRVPKWFVAAVSMFVPKSVFRIRIDGLEGRIEDIVIFVVVITIRRRFGNACSWNRYSPEYVGKIPLVSDVCRIRCKIHSVPVDTTHKGGQGKYSERLVVCHFAFEMSQQWSFFLQYKNENLRSNAESDSRVNIATFLQKVLFDSTCCFVKSFLLECGCHRNVVSGELTLFFGRKHSGTTKL